MERSGRGGLGLLRMVDVTSLFCAAPMSFTQAKDASFEARLEAALLALVSSLKDAAGDAFVGALHEGALAHGEGFTPSSVAGGPAASDPFLLVAVCDVPLPDVPAPTPRLARAPA